VSESEAGDPNDEQDTDDPREGLHGAAGRRDAGDEDDAAEDEQAAQATPRTRRRLKKAAKERLSAFGDLMVAGNQNAEFVIHGEDERSPGVLGALLSRIDTLFETLENAVPQVASLDLIPGASVHIVVEPAESELTRSRAMLAEIAELEEDDPRRDELLRESVPPTLVAADLAVELIERATTTESVGEVLAYGRGAAETLRGLMRLLADEGLGLEASTSLFRRQVEQTDEDAERVARRLEAVGEIEEFQVSVAGVVTMADSEQKRYRLKIADDTAIPTALRNVRGRRIQGPYTNRAGRKLKEEGLWDQEILATIRVRRQKRQATAKMKGPTYTLINARSRFE
jgi:hypothetical protein